MGVLEAPGAPDSLAAEVLLTRDTKTRTQAVTIAKDLARIQSTLRKSSPTTAALAAGAVILRLDVQRRYIAVFARATTMSPGLTVNSVVVPTGTGVLASVVVVQVKIQPERGGRQ